MSKSDGVDHLLTRIRQAGLPEPVTEFRFHPRRKWRFDVCWPSRLVAVEVDGSVYTNGRHTRGKGYEADCEKRNEATRLGWRVYNFSTGQVRRDEAITYLEQVLMED